MISLGLVFRAPGFPGSAKSNKQRGFVLLAVIVILALLASLVLMAASVTDTQMCISADLTRAARLDYAAESGLEHAAWTLNQHSGCENYPDMESMSIGDARFRAEVFPKTGSPVTLSAQATMGRIATRTVTRSGIAVFDRSDLKTRVIDSSAEVKDSYIEGQGGHEDHNKGTDKTFSVSGEPDKVDRGLLEFDLSLLPGSIRIESAVLRLEQDKLGTAETVDVYRLTRGWTEQDVTWETSEGTTSWASVGGDFVSTPVATFVADALGTKTIDLTSTVAGWVSGAYPNFGVMLLTEPSNGAKANKFVSKDDGGAGAPSLTIVYSCECGVPCEGSGSSIEAVAHWRLDDGAGLTAVDSAGSHDGVLTNGPVWKSGGAVEGSLEFDGLNDVVLAAHSDQLLFEDALTITAWVTGGSLDVNGSYDIISKETPGTADNFWITIEDSELLFGVGGGFFNAENSMSEDRWYHVAAVYDGVEGEIRLYVDGIELLVESTNVELEPNTEPVYLGMNWERARPWKGDLDDVRLFDVALSDEEIVNVMNAGASGSPSAVYSTYRDRFDSRSFAQSDGTQNWSTSWLEVGESNGATSGDIQVRDDNANEFALRVRDNDNGGEGVQREFSLIGCTRATLAFDYRRDGLDNTSDYVSVSMSSTGGLSWTELTRLSGPDDDDEYAHYTADITAFVAATTRLRFLSSPGLGGNDEVWFDNVSILCE